LAGYGIKKKVENGYGVGVMLSIGKKSKGCPKGKFLRQKGNPPLTIVKRGQEAVFL